jgi:arginase
VSGGGCPVVVSGDCLTSLGTVTGLQRAGIDPAIVWFDAHGDVQTLETTTSGYVGGITLRLLLGYRPELIGAALGLRPVAEDRVVLVDARDVDPPEAEYLRDASVRRLAVTEVLAVTEADDPRLPSGPIYLHVDVDVVDPAELGGLRYPAPAGPDLRTVTAALRGIVATGRVVGLGLACTWRPGHGAGAALRPALAGLLADLG